MLATQTFRSILLGLLAEVPEEAPGGGDLKTIGVDGVGT